MAEIKRHQRLSVAERDKLGNQVEKSYAKGRSLSEIAEEVGTSAGRVRSLLLQRGVLLRSRGGNTRKPDPERAKTAQQVAKAYAGGQSLAELAGTYGKSASTIRNLVLAGGGSLRARGGSRKK